MNVINSYRKSETEPTWFDPDYIKILKKARLNSFTKPSADQQIIQNQLMIDLKFHGIYQKLDVLHLFASDSGNNFVKINWKNQVIGTSVYGGSGLDFLKIENSHIQSRPSFSLFSSNYTPSVNADKMTINSASFGWKIKGTKSGGTDTGVIRAGVNGLSQPQNALWLYDASYGCKVAINNDSVNTSFGNSYRRISETPDSHIAVTRNGTAVSLYLNSVLQSTISNTPTGLSSMNLEYMVGEALSLQYVFAGAHLTTLDLENLKMLIDNYLANILL